MSKRLLVSLLVLGCSLTSGRVSWAQVGIGGFNATDLGSFSSLNPGIVGGGESMPGAILVKITGEVQCVDCTLEAMGLEEAPGDLYQFSQDNTHMVIKVTKAVPDIAWEMVQRHKLFLMPGEDPTKLQALLSESKAGKRVEWTGGIAPDAGNFIPLTVKVK